MKSQETGTRRRKECWLPSFQIQASQDQAEFSVIHKKLSLGKGKGISKQVKSQNNFQDIHNPHHLKNQAGAFQKGAVFP